MSKKKKHKKNDESNETKKIKHKKRKEAQDMNEEMDNMEDAAVVIDTEDTQEPQDNATNEVNSIETQDSQETDEDEENLPATDLTGEELSAKMKEQMADEDYDEALVTLAQMIKTQYYDIDRMYDGAYAYFMLGDYERAASWVENILQKNPEYVMARVLLARICILEERVDDGLALYDFVLSHYKNTLPQEQLEDIQDILEYFARNDSETIREKYPTVALFTGLMTEEEAAQAQKQQATTSAPATQPEATNDTSSETKSEAGQEKDDTTQAHSEAAQILSDSIPTPEKIRLLNKFAGAYYLANAYESAKVCLTESLKLDSENDETLKNLAILFHAIGDAEKALAFAKAMHGTDFALLSILKA